MIHHTFLSDSFGIFQPWIDTYPIKYSFINEWFDKFNKIMYIMLTRNVIFVCSNVVLWGLSQFPFEIHQMSHDGGAVWGPVNNTEGGGFHLLCIHLGLPQVRQGTRYICNEMSKCER